MSELLGRQDCIENIRKDLVDLQAAILDVFSRTGPVRFSSWKFPDKLSCNLDMVVLLERYDFANGEDAFNQHSHVVLLELMIDRLLLLLQSFSAYVEQLRGKHRREQTPQKGCQSVGLVVRNYWYNLVQFAHTKSDDMKQTKIKTSSCDERNTMSPVSVQMISGFCHHCSHACSSTSTIKSFPPNYTPSSPTQSVPCYPAADRHNVSCQTVESALIPCDSCNQVQSLLKKTGDALVDLFQSEGLPSSLQPLLSAIDETVEMGHMTAGDVAQWANEQLRDMRRLAKHLEDVRGTVQPLKSRLAAAEAEKARFRSQLERAKKEFNQEREKLQADSVQLEFSLSKTQRSMKETEQRLKAELQQLKIDNRSLEEGNARLKEKESTQQHALEELKHEKSALQERVKALLMEEDACHKLKKQIEQMECQISDTQLLLDKEQAKYQSACRQQESVQAKQKSLLARVDVLDEECEELQRQLGEREQKQLSLHSQMQQISEEKEELQAQLTRQQDVCLELQNEKKALEMNKEQLTNSVAELHKYIQALKERERLLVAFPELTPVTQVQPQSTGDVVLDMEQQLQANTIRIEVLEQENATLHRSLEKLGGKVQHNVTRESSFPGTPTEKLENHLRQKHKSPLENSGTAQLGSSNSGREAGRGESGPESVGSEDHVSASPSSLQIHLQTLQLNTGSTAGKKFWIRGKKEALQV
ncbi:coiled-coil domain-containing protein 157 [Pholidichthys leucotaenia]